MKLISFIVLALLGGCSPDFSAGYFLCEAPDECPDGYECVVDRCEEIGGGADSGAGDTGMLMDSTVVDAPTDAVMTDAVMMDAWTSPRPCTGMEVASATGPGEWGPTNMTSHYFWRFEVTTLACVGQIGASFSTIDVAATAIDIGVAPLANDESDPSPSLADVVFFQTIVPGIINVATDVVADIDDDDRCLAAGWYAVVVGSDVTSARLSSNHMASAGQQPPSRGGTTDATGRRLFVRFCE